jgi:hypothetical protein
MSASIGFASSSRQGAGTVTGESPTEVESDLREWA